MRVRKAALLLIVAGPLACGPAVSDHDNRIFATPASIKLSAVDLSMAYASDSGDADDRYRGRVLEVSGVVGKLESGRSTFTLTGTEKGPVVEASLNEDVAVEMLKTLAEAQRVTIKCFCEGLSQHVRLKSCVTADPGR